MRHAEELIAPAADFDSSAGSIAARGARWVRIVAAVLFLATLFGTGAAEILMPPSKWTLVGAEREEAERAARDTRWWDGTWARAIETEFRLRGRVRRGVAPYWSALMLELGDVPGGSLVIGEDGDLFYRERIELNADRSEPSARLLARVFYCASRALAAHGTELVAVPLPRKCVAVASKLPGPMNSFPEFDGTLIRAFQDSGVRTVDLLPRWTAHGAETTYLRHDSHWARVGVQAFAEEVATQVPGLPRQTVAVDHVDGPLRETAGLLADVGILPGHPAYRWANPQVEPTFLLMPPGREERMNTGEEPSEILLAGSSFSRGFNAQAILAATLQTPVEDVSLRGRPPLFSLGESILRRDVERLPAFIIAEFPIHQGASLEAGSEPTMRACFKIVNRLLRDELRKPIALDRFPGASRETPELGRPLFSCPGGTLLSSGDGVLAVRVTIESESMTRWRFASTGIALSFKVPPGRHTRILPVLESDDADGVFWLAPADQPALAASVTTEVVTDVDQTSARPLKTKHTSEDTHRLSGTAPIYPDESLVLQWTEPAPAGLTITARGVTSEGRPVSRRWSFGKAQGTRTAVFTLGVLAYGKLQDVTIEGLPGQVNLTLAPLLKRDPREDSR